MGAAREEFLRRSLVAGVASGVVMSLTALTVGVAPAMADPSGADSDVVVTTTAQAPPQQSAPSRGSESEGRQGRGGRDEAPAATAEAPPQTQTQAPVVTVAPAPVQTPVQTQAPEPTVEPSRAPEPVIVTPTRTAAPETVAPRPEPEPEPAAEPEPVAESPTTTTKRPSTRVTTSAPTEPAPAETTSAPAVEDESKRVEDESKPVEREATTAGTTPSPTTPSPTTPSRNAPSSAEATTADTPSDATPRDEAPESTAEETATEDTVSETGADPTEAAEPGDARESAEATEVEPVARVIETLKPQVLDAPAEDVVLASRAAPVEVNPEPARVEELAQLSSLIGFSNEQDRLREDRRDLREDQRQLREDQRQLREDQRELVAEQRDWDRRVRQWSPDWVQYDEYYRPMIVNPYRDPVRIVYEYQNRPRVVTIPPLQRMVMYAADLAAYSFTAVVLNTINTAVSTAVGVAVGSFFGGGFIPNIANIGNFVPPPPPPLFRYDNVPVQVRYSDAVYEPFRVQRIVDVGDDARYGERRVLLDGVTPAWGVWTQTPSGERQFEVHRTQQYPGLDTPREAPLPGDYRLRLAAEEAPATDRSQAYLITAAIACAVLSLGAVGAAGLLGRRRHI